MKKILSVILIVVPTLFITLPACADVIDDPIPLDGYVLVLIPIICALILIAAGGLVFAIRKKKGR